eukprot:COSAG06_NODE_49082_length_327_cov_6.653509_2_plen_57_part_01
MILPRQARDKHRETQKKPVWLQVNLQDGSTRVVICTMAMEPLAEVDQVRNTVLFVPF